MTRVLSKRVFSSLFLDFTNNSHISPAAWSLNNKRFESYKAAVLNEFGTPLAIEDGKKKKLKKGDVRMKVHYAGINQSDVTMCKGEFEDLKVKLPFHPGFEVAGDITEVTPEATKEGYAVGDRVVALNESDFSGFAEECVANSKDCWHLPSSLKYKKAAALVNSYSTALLGLSRRGHIKEKDRILILAGAGGLGLAAVDIAANLYRAKVIGICDTADNASLLRDKGAWTALSYDPKGLHKKVMDVTEEKGVRIAFDCIGNTMCQQFIKCITNEGSLIVCDSAVSGLSTYPLSALFPNAICLMGVSLRSYRQSAHNIYRQIVQDAIDMCEQGLIAPQVVKEFPLAEINDAFKFISDKTSTGKVVLKLRE